MGAPSLMLSYTSCKGCSDGRWTGTDKKRPRLSVLVQFSTIGDSRNRKQKTSGSFGLCSACLAALAAGRVPTNMLTAIKNAFEALEGKQ